MTVEVTRFQIEDIAELNSATQGDDQFEYRNETLKLIASRNEHFYTVRIDGQVKACAGAVEYWQDRAEIFVVFDAVCKREFLSLYRALKNLLLKLPFRRIEATVCKTYEEGHRLAKLMGFKCEAETLKSYSPTGEDYSLYVRVR